MTVFRTFTSPVSIYPCITTFLSLFMLTSSCVCLSLPLSLAWNLCICLTVPDITVVCAVFLNRNDFILIILCQREQLLFFMFFPLPPHFSSCFLPCIPLSIQFSFSLSLSWSEHFTPVKANGFYLLMGELLSSILCSLAAPELCYFLWCLISLETPLASTRAAQDSSLHCVFQWIDIGPLLIITPTHFHS